MAPSVRLVGGLVNVRLAVRREIQSSPLPRGPLIAAVLFRVDTAALPQTGTKISLSCANLSSTERQKSQTKVSRDDPQRVPYSIGLNSGGLRTLPVC